MKKISIIIVLFITVASFSQTSDKELIHNAFNKYKEAILADNGLEAVKYIDSNTLNYYHIMLDHVLKSDSSVVKKLSILDRLMLFVIRHKTPKEQLISFNGESLLVYAIESGMVGKNGVRENTIGEVTVQGSSAKAQMIVAGTLSPLSFQFNKEGDQWKINLTSIFPETSAAFKAMADDSELGENEYIFKLLELMTGRQPDEKIWLPLM